MKTWKRTLFAATLVAGGVLVVGCKDGNLKDKEWGSGGPGANGPGRTRSRERESDRAVRRHGSEVRRLR
jgi:hypothetical protein